MAYANPFWKGIYNLLLGLKTTLKYLFSHAITLQYPTERWEMPKRSRGLVVLLSDKETGELNCTACLLCAKACPTAAITIDRFKGEDRKWKLRSFTVDNTICCYCGFCQEACNFDAMMLVPKYEYSSYDKESLVYNTDTLQKLGLDVDYTPKRPKKKPKPVVKPAEAETALTPESEKPDAAAEAEPTKPNADDLPKSEGDK